MAPIYEVLGEFSRQYPDTAVLLHSSIDGLDQYFERHPAGLAFATDLTIPDARFEQNSVGAVQLVAVAAPSHPLVSFSSPLSPDTLAGYFQIVLSRQHYLRGDRNSGVLATRSWHVDNLHIKQGLILNGHGWGSLALAHRSGRSGSRVIC